MKKLIAVLLSLAMLLGCTALAENEKKMDEIELDGSFILKMTMPESYSLEESGNDDNGWLLATIASEDDAKPYMVLSVAFDELMANVGRMNELDDAALAKIEATFAAEDKVEISYTETALGTKLMVVKEVEGLVDYVDFYTIYKGYGIEFVLVSAYGLTDGDIQTAVKFLSDLEFVEVQ